jgi:hypothetical protein
VDQVRTAGSLGNILGVLALGVTLVDVGDEAISLSSAHGAADVITVAACRGSHATGNCQSAERKDQFDRHASNMTSETASSLKVAAAV